jgi:large subunit ribosomal protein L15
MALHTLKANPGSRKQKVRVGRGIGSGFGKRAGRGQKGQWARSGGGVAAGFEGGQNPIYRRIPKRGFKNYTQTDVAVVNLADLEQFVEKTTITPTLLAEAGLVKKNIQVIKVLGFGKLSKSLTVSAHRFSKTAQAAIEKAGGTVEVLGQ